MRRGRLAVLVVAACALTFVLGLAIGRMTRPATRSNAMDPDAVVATLTRQLELDTAQQRQVGDIFRRHQRAVDDAWRTVQPHVLAAIDSTQREVLQALKPAQRDRFVQIVRAAHPRMERRATQ
jgi:hypothetical protein